MPKKCVFEFENFDDLSQVRSKNFASSKPLVTFKLRLRSFRSLFVLLFLSCISPFQDTCRNIFCSPGFMLKNYTCRDIAEMESSRSFATRFKLIPDHLIPNNVSEALRRKFQLDIKSAFDRELKRIGMEYRVCRILMAYMFDDSEIDFVVVDMELYYYYQEHTLSSAIDSVTSLYGLQINTSQLDTADTAFVIHPFYDTRNIEMFGEDMATKFPPELRMKMMEFSTNPTFHYCKLPPTRLFVITRLNVCPKVTIPRELVWDIVNGTLCLKEGVPCIEEHQYDISDENVTICADDFIYFSDERRESGKHKSADNGIASYLSLVVTSLSMLCLLITILTYILFPILRTTPGKNNLALCVNLLCAQALYQFGINRHENPLACKMIGGAIHFLWLSSITWMNICCFHMFRIFATQVKVRKPSKEGAQKTLCSYVAYSLGFPAVFVVANLVTSLLKSNMADWGYGGNVCYISSPDMVGFTFALPVGLLLVANFVFFFIVIVKIKRVPDIKSSTHGPRQNMLVYIKLSCITGLFWITGFIYQFLKLGTLEYVFIILNAGQGIFIMTAFILNKRVYNMYNTYFKGKSFGRPTTTSSNTETTFSRITDNNT